MTGWGKEWIISKELEDEINKAFENEWPIVGVDLGWDTSSNAAVYAKNLKSQGSNLVDAEAYLYFQCEGCNTILDPHTKSFAKLQQNRVDAGWKCVWNTNGLGYNVYCHKCGDGR